jgi:tetratricopeptide (TPR) repeat protein
MKMGILGGTATAFRWRRLVFLLVCLASQIPWVRSSEAVYSLTTDGPQSFKEGKKLFGEEEYEDASMYFWRAVLLQAQSSDSYTVEEAFTSFMQCYAILGRTADGFVFIAKESIQRGQIEMGAKYLEQALEFDPTHAEAREVQSKLESQSQGGGRVDPSSFTNVNRKERTSKFQPGFGTPEADDPLKGKTPEDLYEYGSTLFSRRNYEHCADVFELSCRRSNYQLGPSCSNAVYCRSMVLDWGFNGTSFDEDMKRIIELTEREAATWRRGNSTHFTWNRATSVHPHMMLGYPIPPILKRYVAESVAFMDEKMARLTTLGEMSPLPVDMPFSPASHVEDYKAQAAEPGFKLKVGFVSSGFNSKAVLYLSQDIFRFYSRSKIEMHIFSLGPPDNDNFIKYGMGGTDWRKRVQGQVDHFHDVVSMTYFLL